MYYIRVYEKVRVYIYRITLHKFSVFSLIQFLHFQRFFPILLFHFSNSQVSIRMLYIVHILYMRCQLAKTSSPLWFFANIARTNSSAFVANAVTIRCLYSYLISLKALKVGANVHFGLK